MGTISIFVNRYQLLIAISLVSSLGLGWNCKTTELAVIPEEPGSKESISAEDLEKKKQALGLVNTGNKSFQEGRYKESITLAEKSIRIYPTSEAFYLIGVSMAREGKNEEAKSNLEKALALEPKSEKILLNLGLVNSTLGYENDALLNYQSLQKINPGESLYVYREAVQWKALKQYNQSIERLLTIEPDSFSNIAELYSQIGDVYLKLKNYPKAKEYLSKAEAASPNQESLRIRSNSVRVASFLEDGNAHLVNKDYKKAVQSYSNAVNLDPKNAGPLVFRSKAYILDKEYLLAEKDLEKAYRLNDENLSVYETYSLLYYSMDQFSKSKLWAEKGLKVFPRSPELRNRLGLAEWKSGNTKQAMIEFQKANEIQPKFLDSEYNLAYLLLEESRFLEARRIFQSLIEKHPSRREEFKKSLVYAEQMEFIKRGDDLLVQGKLRATLSQYDKAKAIQPKEPAVWNAYGRGYYAFKEYNLSEANYSMANQLEPDNLESLIGLLRVYSMTSNSSKESAIRKRIEALTKGSPTLLIAMARIKEDRGSYPEAEKDYLDIRKKYPENESIGIRLGVLYYKMALQKNEQEDYVNALSYLERSKKENPGLLEIEPTERVIRENQRFAKVIPTLREANRHFDKKDFKGAQVLYNKAYQESGKPNLLVKVAECYVGMGEDEKGIALLEKSDRESRDRSTDFKEAINSYLLQKGEIARAERGFLDIVQTNPGSHYSFYKLGMIRLDRGDYETAIEFFDKALILHYNFPAGNTAKGIAYYRMGDMTRAKEEFEVATSKDQEFEIAKLNMGILYFNQSRDKEAKAIFQELAKSKDSSDPFLQLSFMEFKEGNIKKAESYILEALKIERTPVNLNAYIRILDAKKDSRLRDTIVSELTKNYPDSTYSKNLLRTLPGNSHSEINRLTRGGNWKSQPLMNSKGIIRNFPTSILYSDAKSGETLLRIFPEEEIEFLGMDWYLMGIGRKNIYLWNLENGEVVSKLSHNMEEDVQVVQARLFYKEGKEAVGVLSRKKGKASDRLMWTEVSSSGATQSIPMSIQDPIHGIVGDDISNPILLTSIGYGKPGDIRPWREPGSLMGVIQTGKNLRADHIYSLGQRIVLQVGDEFWETSLSKPDETRRLEFAKGAKRLQFTNTGYVSFHSQGKNKGTSSREGQIRYWDETGKLLSEVPWVGNEEIQTLTLSK